MNQCVFFFTPRHQFNLPSLVKIVCRADAQLIRFRTRGGEQLWT